MPQKCIEADSMLFARKLLMWFKENKRDLPWRKECSRYRILVTEKLPQQTDVAHVAKIYGKFFDRYPTLGSLAAADQEEIARTIKALGFWRIRSRDLKLLASQLLNQYCGVIPGDKQKLLQLFGVGDYIANAVSCFGFGKEEALIDVNVRRVAKRLFYWKSGLPPDRTLLKIFLAVIPASKTKEFNWALLDFAAKICTKSPRCNRCFATEFCEYFSDMNKI